MAHTYHGILLNNKKEQSVDTHSNFDSLENILSEIHQPQRLNTVLFHLHNILKWKRCYELGIRAERLGAGAVIKKSTQRILVVMNCFGSWLWWWIHEHIIVIAVLYRTKHHPPPSHAHTHKYAQMSTGKTREVSKLCGLYPFNIFIFCKMLL